MLICLNVVRPSMLDVTLGGFYAEPERYSSADRAIENGSRAMAAFSEGLAINGPKPGN
jgi:hypothetical protein